MDRQDSTAQLTFPSTLSALVAFAFVCLNLLSPAGWAQIQYPQPRVVDRAADVSGGYIQPDGKLIVSGLFENAGNVQRRGLARLNADGTLDASFTVDQDGTVNDVCGLGNRVFVLGTFTTFNGVALAQPGYAELNIVTGQVSSGPASNARMATLECDIQQNVLYLMGDSSPLQMAGCELRK
jgi:hypothetical protein